MQSREESENELYSYLNHYVESNAEDSNEQALQAQLLAEIQRTNDSLKTYGLQALGNLFDSQPTEIRKTLKTIDDMLKQRKLDMQQRSDTYQRMQRKEAELTSLDKQHERLTVQYRSLENELNAVKMQLKQVENKWEGEKEKWVAEREELKKDMAKLQHKTTQYQHEIRNKEKASNKLQDQIKAKLYDKSTIVKNSIEFTKPISHHGVPLPKDSSAESQFNQLSARTHEQAHKRALAENTDLRECLKTLQQELFEIVTFKSEAFKKQFSAQFQQDPDSKLLNHQLAPFREELFDAHFGNTARAILPKFKENLAHLRQFLQRIDHKTRQLSEIAGEREEDLIESSEEVEDEFTRVKSLAQLRNLARNYKAVSECQERLLETRLVQRGYLPQEEEKNVEWQSEVLSQEQVEAIETRLEEHRIQLVDEKNSKR